MASIQERLQRKREPLDKWSCREQLALACAVSRSGDQNWMSVSRALKPYGDSNRPADWFHQKNCAAQYGALLENFETPKRKKRTSGVETAIETPSELILRKLLSERKFEIKSDMTEEKDEYLKIKDEMVAINDGTISMEELDILVKEIDAEEASKEREAVSFSQWLKEREVRKEELERVWRPVKVNSPLPIAGQKRKASDPIVALMEVDMERCVTPTNNEPSKPALSPLLTSLLKSPSHSQNVVTSSILHSAITSQRPVNSNPTIASLLNSSAASVQVSPGLQQLVSTAISQEPINIIKDHITDLLDVDPLPNLKVEDIESTILDPLPEIKNEEVDVIISDLIESADIVTDPEQHLLDGNDDIITDFENELEELVNEENAAAEAAAKAEANKNAEKIRELPEIDPFEFQEEELYEPTKLPVKSMNIPEVIKEPDFLIEEIKKESPPPPPIEEPKQEEPIPGSVEIVEVVVMEDEDISKELNKTQIQDIVHSASKIIEIKDEPKEENIELETISEATSESLDLEIKREAADSADDDTSRRRNTFTPEYSEDIFDDMNIEVTKLDKKAKRDYSRTKKKEETDFDILLAVEQAANSTIEEESILDAKIKIENERSNSPWTEEENNSLHTRRRYSTPATPIDSVPNSPASSSAYFEDDRDYRNWKKAIMLVYSRLTTHKYASLFLKPITNEHAPGYHNIVKRPIDLQTIRKNIEIGTIRSTVEFQRDVLLMFNNAIMYNKTNHTVYNMATEMMLEGIEQIKILLQAQQTDAPARRETRTSEGPGNKRKRITDEGSNKIKKRKED